MESIVNSTSLLHCLYPMIPLSFLLLGLYFKLLTKKESSNTHFSKFVFSSHFVFNLYGWIVFLSFSWIRDVLWLSSYGESLFFTALLISTLQWIGSFFARLQPIGFFSMIPVVVPLTLAVVLPEKFWAPHAQKALFHWHLFFSLCAYATFSVAFILVIMHLSLDSRLKRKKFDTFFQNLPALSKISNFANHWILLGLIFSVLSGIFAIIWKGQVETTSFTIFQKFLIYFPLLAYATIWTLSKLGKVRGVRNSQGILAIYFLLLIGQAINYFLY